MGRMSSIAWDSVAVREAPRGARAGRRAGGLRQCGDRGRSSDAHDAKKRAVRRREVGSRNSVKQQVWASRWESVVETSGRLRTRHSLAAQDTGFHGNRGYFARAWHRREYRHLYIAQCSHAAPAAGGGAQSNSFFSATENGWAAQRMPNKSWQLFSDPFYRAFAAQTNHSPASRQCRAFKWADILPQAAARRSMCRSILFRVATSVCLACFPRWAEPSTKTTTALPDRVLLLWLATDGSSGTFGGNPAATGNNGARPGPRLHHRRRCPAWLRRPCAFFASGYVDSAFDGEGDFARLERA